AAESTVSAATKTGAAEGSFATGTTATTTTAVTVPVMAAVLAFLEDGSGRQPAMRSPVIGNLEMPAFRPHQMGHILLGRRHEELPRLRISKQSLQLIAKVFAEPCIRPRFCGFPQVSFVH